MGAAGLDSADLSAESNIEQWKIKRLIKNLQCARGAGTSMISLIIKPKDELSRISRMLTEELGTASNIKSRVNRLSVLSAIASTQQRLKRYNRTPPNGLVIFCGTIVTDEGKEKRVNMDFEPFKAVNTSLYLCDNKFHVEPLAELLESNDKYGFIIMDGSGCLYGTLQGNTREVLHRFTIDLPKKHGRGGQSALRFARLRMEKRHNYVRRVAECSVQMFITADRPNISGLILAGSADFKTELAQCDMFDQRLAAKIIKIVDISYGGENGFNQAIELAQDTLASVKFIHERKIIQKFMEEVALDSGKYVFGVEETLRALESGAAETLIVWESLETQRLSIKNPQTDVETIVFQRSEKDDDAAHLTDKATGVELELVEKIPLVEWIVQNYTNYGAQLEFVTNCSQEGSQFQKGFGGFGALLRYKMDTTDYDDIIDTHQLDDDDSDDNFM